MSEEKSFEELLEENSKPVNLEKIVTGKVITITKKGEIFVDIGYKADGLIPKNEYSFNENDNPKDEFKPGDTIKAEILKMNDGQGNVLLSYKRVKQREASKQLEEKINNNEIFEEKVSDILENGLIVILNNKRVFIPYSQTALKGDKLETLKDKKVKFKVIEYNPEKNRIIGSIRILQEEEKNKKLEEFWNTISTGKEYIGTVENITNYGLFVSIENNLIQGLLHISEISWSKNVNLQKMFKNGDKIKVTVKEYNKEENKLQFTYSDKGENPWNEAESKYHITDIVTGNITKILPFGAFVQIEPGIEGLVHISEICEERIAKVEDKLRVGQKVNAKIINLDIENKKIELSIRELEGTSNEYIEE